MTGSDAHDDPTGETPASGARPWHSAEHFRALISELEVGVVVQGAASEILVANRRALELLGLSQEQLASRTSYDPAWSIIREDGSPFPADERPVATALRTRAPVRNVVMGISRPVTRDRVWLLVTAIPELDAKGELLHVVATLDDLTERKRLEDSLAAARKLESVGRLAGGIAHDFNNLLTVITSAAELALLRLPGETKARGDIEAVLDAARRAGSLTQQLLAFARHQELSAEIIDLGERVERAHELLGRLAGSHIQLVLDVQRGTWGNIDPTALERILTNLAANAAAAMPEGGRLTIAVGRIETEAGPRARLTIGDTGCGMDETVRLRAFDPFFTTKPVGQGTGLGLATVLGIVQQSGGTIALDSAPGAGSTFTIDLPLAEPRPR